MMKQLVTLFLLLLIRGRQIAEAASNCSCGNSPKEGECGSRYMHASGRVTYNVTSSPNLITSAFSEKICKFDMSWNGERNSVGLELQLIRDSDSTGEEVGTELRKGFESKQITDQMFGAGSNVGMTSFSYVFYCELSDSPETPHNGFRSVLTPTGVELTNPPVLVESGTEISITCEKYYDVKIVDADEVGVPSIRCGENSVWVGANQKMECVFSLGFKIAIISSVVSGIIILFITSLFIISCCSQRTPRSKERHEFDEELDLVHRNWEESQERQMMR